MNPVRIASAGLAALVLAACGSEPPATPRAAVTALAATPVSRLPTTSSQRWTGVARAASSATLTAQTAGEVERVEVQVGDRVEPGAILAGLRAVGQRAGRDQAAAALRAARAEQVDAGQEIERVRAMRERGLVAQASLDQATARFDAAKAALAAARAAVAAADEMLSYTSISAPYAGVVTARHVEPGESVQPGQPLLSLAAPGLWWIDASLPAAAARALPEAAAARVAGRDGQRWESTELLVFPGTDPGSQTTTVRVILHEDGGQIHEGQALTVELPDASREALGVATESVVRRSEVTAVYVIASDGQPLLRAVRLGARHGDRVEVLAGLSEGDQVVNDPASALLALRHAAESRRD